MGRGMRGGVREEGCERRAGGGEVGESWGCDKRRGRGWLGMREERWGGEGDDRGGWG